MSIEFRPLQSSDDECFAYFGDREGWLVVMGQHRDSDALARSNFRATLRALGGEDDDAGVAVERFGHCAVGWTEAILVRPDADAKLAIARRIAERLEDYPVVDEDDWSELEWDEVCATWEGMSLRDRVEECREAGVSVFAARRPVVPERVMDRLRDRL